MLASRFQGECLTAVCRSQPAEEAGKRRLGGVEVQNGDGLSLGGPVMTGGNSGHQAIGIAVQRGASHVLLLGYDMHDEKGKHFFGDHPDALRNPSAHRMSLWRKSMGVLADAAKDYGITIINCSRDTALDCFPRMSLDDAVRATTTD